MNPNRYIRLKDGRHLFADAPAAQVEAEWNRARPVREMLLAGGRLPDTRARRVYIQAMETEAQVQAEWDAAAPIRAHLLAGGTLATAPAKLHTVGTVAR